MLNVMLHPLMENDIIIKTNGEKINIHPRNGKNYKLDELQSIVGGLIEIIRLPDNKIMIINKEGKLKNLPFNALAKEMFQTIYMTFDIIVGDVLITHGSRVI